MLKKSNENDDNFTNFTIQLDVKNINGKEEIDFKFKIWELIDNKVEKSSNEFYITLNIEDKNQTLEKINTFSYYQKVITNFITYIKNTSKINNPKVLVETSQFINVPEENLYKTKNKNKIWIMIFTFLIIIFYLEYKILLIEYNDHLFIYHKYAIKSYQINFFYCTFLYCH